MLGFLNAPLDAAPFQPPGRSPARTQKKSTKRPLHPVRRRTASVVLGDGRTVRGEIAFRAPERIQFKHERGGVAYTKEFSIDEIRSVRVRKWKGRFIRRNKEGEVYEFAPHDFEVRLRSGTVLQRRGSFLPFYKRFPLKNADGRVALFAFWRDLRRADGSWYTGMKGQLRTECHKDVVRMLEFPPRDDPGKHTEP